MSTAGLRCDARLVLLATFWSFTPAGASNGAIGLYFDADCATCSHTVSIGVPFTLFVNATLEGATVDGTLGAEFRITGMPAGWYTQAVPNPLVEIAVGDPLGGGTAIAFTSCTAPPPPCINLYTVWVVPTTSAENLRLQVEQAISPACETLPPSLCTPLLVGCDIAYTRYPATGGTAILNGPPCAVATQLVTWSRVKQMY